MKRWTEADLANLAIKRTTGTVAHYLKLESKYGTFNVYIGIDTGVNTGIAVYYPDSKLLAMIDTVKVHKAMKLVETIYNAFESGLLVRVEDARKRKWFGNAGREQLQGAGSIKRDASIWEDFLTDLGVRFEMVAPKSNKTKMTAFAFKQLTGWDKVCSNHARDAAMLVYGY